MLRSSWLILLTTLAPLLRADERTAPVGQVVGAYRQEVARSFGVADGLPSADVLGVVLLADGTVLVGTAQGLARRDRDRFVALEVDGLPAGPATPTGELDDGAPIVRADGARWRVASGRATSVGERDEDPVWARRMKILEKSIAAMRDGIPVTGVTCVAHAPGGVTWYGTIRGAVRLERDGKTWAYRQGRRWLPDDHVRSIAVDRDGNAWLATPQGVGFIGYRPMTLAQKARHFEDEIDRRHRRTPYGFVLGARLDRPGDLSSWHNHDSDNDGLWTSMYGAGECFAWAAMRDSAAKKRAERAFDALHFLGTVTQGGEHPAPPGFVARTVLPTSGPNPNDGRLQRDRRVKRESDRLWKVIDPRWPVSADGKWYWKCDTSSDELDGHFFFYGLYYDLVADTDAERARVRRHVTALADHLVRHDFNLVDHDGLPTRWGHFGPRDLNFDPAWWEERGLNSLSILAYLKVAEHIADDGPRGADGALRGARFREAARRLIDEHGYLQNTLYPKNQEGIGTGNQSDDEMAIMNYHSLLRYETDPRRRSVIAYSFRKYWRLERPEMNPFFDFVYASVMHGATWTDPWGTRDLSPTGAWLEESIDVLQRLPLDRVDWRLTNSHRRDLVRLSGPAGRGGARGHRRDGRVLPIDERCVVHWNHDPWALDQGGSGRYVADGTVFLLPYYMGRYYGFVREVARRPTPPTESPAPRG